MSERTFVCLIVAIACAWGCDAFGPRIVDHAPTSPRDAGTVDAGGFGGSAGFSGFGGSGGLSGFGGSGFGGSSGFGGDSGTSGSGGTGASVSVEQCIVEAQIASEAVPQTAACLDCVCQLSPSEITACSRTDGCWELAVCARTLCDSELDCTLALCNVFDAFAVWNPARFTLSYCADTCWMSDLDAGAIDSSF